MIIEGAKKVVKGLKEIINPTPGMFDGLTGEAQELVSELGEVIDSLPETDYGKLTLESVIGYYRSNGTQKKNELAVLLNKKYDREGLTLEQITAKVQDVIRKVERLYTLIKGPIK